MTVLSGFAPFLGCLIIFKHLIKNPAKKLFFEDSIIFMPKQWDDKSKQTEANNNLSKKDKKNAQKKLNELKEAGDTVFCQKLNIKNVTDLFTLSGKAGDLMDSVGILTVMLALNAAAYIISAPILGTTSPTMLLVWTSICFFYVLLAAFQIDFSGVDVSRKSPRWHCVLLFAFGALAAFGFLVIAPDYEFMNVRLDTAAQSLSRSLTSIVAAIEKRHSQMLPSATTSFSDMTISIEPLYLAVALSISAGFLTIILSSSAQRFSRLVHLQTGNIPLWARSHMQQSLPTRTCYRLAFILPFLLALGFIVPISDFWIQFFTLESDEYDVGGFQSIQTGLISAIPIFPFDQAMATLTAAVAAVANTLLTANGVGVLSLGAAVVVAWVLCVRPLVQTHLSTSLLEWHVVQHSGAGTPQVQHQLVVHRVSKVNLLAVKTGLQLLAPPALLLSLLVLHGLNDDFLLAWRSGAAATGAAVRRVALGGGQGGEAGMYGSGSTAAAWKWIQNAAESNIGRTALGFPSSLGEADSESLKEAGWVKGYDVVMKHLVREREAKAVQPPREFCTTLAEFLTFWICAVWAIFSAFWLCVYRLGMHLG
mmetsp:Transcript_7372/g.14516  ORF Transcript_7372/g.14516 Transcript_7372/m.14516 type:complete len:592 (-) Transcript_7372:100-1875(-)